MIRCSSDHYYSNINIDCGGDMMKSSTLIINNQAQQHNQQSEATTLQICHKQPTRSITLQDVPPQKSSDSIQKQRPRADPPKTLLAPTTIHIPIHFQGEAFAKGSFTSSATHTPQPPAPESLSKKLFVDMPEPEAGTSQGLIQNVVEKASTTLQYSVHSPGRHLIRELQLVFCHYAEYCQQRGFKDVDEKKTLKDILVIPTLQLTLSDIMAVNADTQWERNLLLEYFYAWAHQLCGKIHEKGYWADFTDPASGYPVYTSRGTSLYPDVDGTCRLLKYETHDVGCCRVLSHPKWGTRNYPATLFTTAPLEAITRCL